MDEHEPTRQERRDERKAKERDFRADNRRSVRITALLSVRPKHNKHRRTRREDAR